MSMSIAGQEVLIGVITNIVVDVAIQGDDEYNSFMDAIITSIFYVARQEQLWDDYEIQSVRTIVNNRAKEILANIEFDDDESKPNISDIDNIINKALNNLKK
jgi:hypothetical protein